jgi:hypothetical protein
MVLASQGIRKWRSGERWINTERRSIRAPGEYKARLSNGALKVLIPNNKGEVKEHTFVILSVRKKVDLYQQTKHQ